MKTIVQGLLILNYKFITGGYQKQPDQTGCDRDKLIYKILRFFSFSTNLREFPSKLPTLSINTGKVPSE